MEQSLGEIAYNAYGDTTGFKNYQQLPMPAWDENDVRYAEGIMVLTGIIKQAWENAALSIYHLSNPALVSEQYAWRDKFDDRQQKLIQSASEYAKDAFGDVGHNYKVVVAMLAEELDLRAKVK